MKKNALFVLLVSLLLVLSFSVASWAASDPSSLVVLRASNDTLWKATCNGTSCSAFTSFPGLFGSQPTVLWDEDIQSFVLWGVASDGSVWRSTFTRLGVFNNNWAQVPGTAASPLGGSGGGIMNNFWADNGFNTNTTISSTGSVIRSAFAYAPVGGFFLVRATGEISVYHGNTTSSAYTCVQIRSTNTFNYSDDNACSGQPAGPIGYYQDVFAIERWFNATGGTEPTFYVLGDGPSSPHSSYAWNTTASVQFFPYSY